MKSWIMVFILAITLTGCTSSDTIQVCSVHDGDTLTTCDGEKIRLFGVDAPEISQKLGKPARNALQRLVLHQNVSLSCDGKSYKRRVCRVTKSGININEEMVKEGWAFDYRRYSHGAFLNAQTLAQSKHLGIWQKENGGARPWDYRRHQYDKRQVHRTFKF
jgi:micrococcal nuclease